MHISDAVSKSAAMVSLVLCVATVLVWNFSFGFLKGDQHGVNPISVADGTLSIGPLLPAGQKPIESGGWNIGVASWHRFSGIDGGRWTSFSLDLWPLVVVTSIPAIVRYRLIQRGRDRIRFGWQGRRQEANRVKEGIAHI